MFHRLKREVQREMVKEWKETKKRTEQENEFEAKYSACTEKEKKNREIARHQEISKARLKDYKEKKVSFGQHVPEQGLPQGLF